MTLVFYELIDLKLNKEKPKGKQQNKKTLNVLRKDNEHWNFYSHLLENQLRKLKGMGSNISERVDILLCIINHFRIIYSNQINKKWRFEKFYF